MLLPVVVVMVAALACFGVRKYRAPSETGTPESAAPAHAG
jgi:hypothetical protein